MSSTVAVVVDCRYHEEQYQYSWGMVFSLWRQFRVPESVFSIGKLELRKHTKYCSYYFYEEGFHHVFFE